ncbi:uncharacterized mitochondrial protein-like protein [Tanacetum coccineum]
MFDESLNPSTNVDLQAPEVIASYSGAGALTFLNLVDKMHPHNKWTKDHPLENIIGALDRPVSTRLQLHEQALFCYYDAFLTSVKPKNYKEALTQACWIEAMQEELYEFERLEVWELVPPPDKAFVISLKWIYKVKLDELGEYGYESCGTVDTSHGGRSPNWMRIKKGKLLIHHTIVARPTKFHLNAVKRIFRYLKGTVHRGLWYPKDSSFALTAFADADHAGCQDTRRSTSGSI